MIMILDMVLFFNYIRVGVYCLSNFLKKVSRKGSQNIECKSLRSV